MALFFDLAEDPTAACARLLSTVDGIPLAYRKWIATYYPDACVRRAFLKSLGVVFVDDSSFCNMGFSPVPNSPSDTHVYIGKNVSIGPNVTCVTESCANNGSEINSYCYTIEKLTKKGDIRIEDEAWIGANATILPGVKIGRCAVIGASCVMIKDAEPYGIYAGIPGGKIGDIRVWGKDCE